MKRQAGSKIIEGNVVGWRGKYGYKITKKYILQSNIGMTSTYHFKTKRKARREMKAEVKRLAERAEKIQEAMQEIEGEGNAKDKA